MCIRDRLDKSFSMVNAYACKRIQPNLETLQRIAEILQVDLKDVDVYKRQQVASSIFSFSQMNLDRINILICPSVVSVGTLRCV